MRSLLLILLCALLVGCGSTKDDLRQLESELRRVRTDFSYFRLGVAPVGSAAAVEAMGKDTEDSINRSLRIVRRLNGS